MADKETYELDVEIDDRDIDKTEKKLRSLDKLLQQTRRRAGLLGKTRIKPVLALDDRWTSAARKAEAALERLHRTAAKPTVQFNDRVSAAALKVRASLASLAATPWRVSVAGVDWEAVVGDSFTGWMSSDGKSTLKRISSTIGTMLNDGLKEKIMESLGLVEIPVSGKQGGLGQGGRSAGKRSGSSGIPKRQNPPLSSLPGFPKLDAYDLFSHRMAEISQNGGATQTVLSGLGVAFNSRSKSPQESGGSSPSSGKQSPIQNVLDGTSKVLEFGGKVIKEYFKDRIKETLEPKLTGAAGSVKNWWQGKWPGLRSRLEPKISPKNMERLTDAGTKGLSFLGDKVTPIVKKMGGYVGLLMDGYEIFSAKPGRERYQKVTSAVLGGLLGLGGAALGTFTAPVTGGVGMVAFPAIGAAVGDSLGDPIGGFIYDFFHGKIKPKPQVYSDRVMAPSVQGVTRPEPTANVPKVMGTPVPNYYQLPEEVRSKIGGAGYNQPPTPVNVSMSKGTINLTIDKEKLDYEKLAETAGWKIANEVRYAMQNLK
ncbi:hypothetical protein [Paenibacillus macerans]|uniref:hypothetical protein n=1 Tax=Paenibacillus macerans TaxID=44252 RepID=UPI003D31434E